MTSWQIAVRRGLIVMLAGLAMPAAADRLYDQCMARSDNSNTAWGECAAARATRDDVHLNAAWRAALVKAGGAQSATGTALLAEQRAWLAYRDMACRYYDNPDEFGREGQVLHYPDCVSDVVTARTAFLTAFAKGPL